MMFPKDRLQPMHLLAMMGQNGIGNLGYTLPGAAPTSAPTHIERRIAVGAAFHTGAVRRTGAGVSHSGVGIAGVQPKIMVADRATVPIPR